MKQIMIGITVVFLIVFLNSCSATKDVAPVLSESIKILEDTAVITTGDLALIEYYDGIIKPISIEITASKVGIIEEWRVSLGDRVKRGDVIMTLRKVTDYVPNDWDMDQDDIAYRLEEIDLKIDILEAKRKVLQKSGEDNSSIELDLISLDIQQLQIEKEYLSTSNLSLEGNYDQQEIYDGMEKEGVMEILAPTDGTIVYREGSSKGERISGNTILCTIATEEKILECSYINDRVASSAEQIYGIIDGKQVALEQDSISDGSISDQKTYLRLKDSNSTLNIGTYVPIYVVTQNRADVNYIPVDALHSDIEGYYIYVLSESEWKITRVEIGLMTASYVEITSNIQQGEVVLVAK